MSVLLTWIKTNIVLLWNAASLVSTTAVTSALGFAFWWSAARLFHTEEVGLASAAISAMSLLGTICTLGLGTLLIGELPRQPSRVFSLTSAALLLVLGVGTLVGIFFALATPLLSSDLSDLRDSTGIVLFFGLGIGLTAVTMVLDQALIGVLRGGLQLQRNTWFAVAKLVVLLMAGLLLRHKNWFVVYAAWVIGSIYSLLSLGIYILRRKRAWSREDLPQWTLLRKLGPSALQHYALNMILQVPDLTLPLLVTVIISASANAGFYVAAMLANFVFVVSNALTTALYATTATESSALGNRSRLTLGVALLVCCAANVVLFIGARPLLLVFGHTYARDATWSLRLLGMAAFPLVIKSHYTALCRIQQRIVPALLPLAASAVLEIVVAAIGAHLDGLVGLSLGWLLVLLVEAAFMFRPVYNMASPRSQQSAQSHDGKPVYRIEGAISNNDTNEINLSQSKDRIYPVHDSSDHITEEIGLWNTSDDIAIDTTDYIPASSKEGTA
jgi:O-antigen/teichoic acid export membrane protein